MIEPLLHLKIESDVEQGGVGVFHPGDSLCWESSVDGVDAQDIQALENSVLWYTEGKGEEDLAVHFFDRLSTADPNNGELHLPQQWQTTLPMSPLSYSGVIVKVRWCVRLRVFLKSGKELCQESTFQLSGSPHSPTNAHDDEASRKQVANDNG